MERGEIHTGRGGLVEHAIPEEAEELWTEDGHEHVGWFCVSTDPFPCPAPGCLFVAEFMTAAHLVLVWHPDQRLVQLVRLVHGRPAAGRRLEALPQGREALLVVEAVEHAQEREVNAVVGPTHVQLAA